MPTAIAVALLSLIGATVFIYKEAPKNRAEKWWQTEKWSERVSILRRKVAAREIPEIPSTLAEFNANSAATIPTEMVQNLESMQTWWEINDVVFIHLNNTTPFTLAGFGINFSDDRCNSSGPVQRWTVKPSTGLAPGRQAVLSFSSQSMKSGCLIIESAWR